MSSLKHHLERGLCFCHTHVLTNLHLVPIAKLTHTPHGFGRSALHWMHQSAASIAQSSPLLHVLVWGYVLVYIQGYCCSVNRQIWWLRWQSWPNEDIYSSSMCGCRNERSPPNSGFINMLHPGFLSFLMHGILCDTFDSLPPISAPYLYSYVFYHLDVDVVWPYRFTCWEKCWHFLLCLLNMFN